MVQAEPTGYWLWVKRTLSARRNDGPPGIHRSFSEFFLDADQLVVFRQPV